MNRSVPWFVTTACFENLFIAFCKVIAVRRDKDGEISKELEPCFLKGTPFLAEGINRGEERVCDEFRPLSRPSVESYVFDTVRGVRKASGNPRCLIDDSSHFYPVSLSLLIPPLCILAL